MVPSNYEKWCGTSAANLSWLWCNRKSFSIRDRKGQLELLFLGHLGLNQLLYFFKASALSLAKREKWLPSPTAARHPAGQQVEPYKLFCFRIQMHGALWNKEKNKIFRRKVMFSIHHIKLSKHNFFRCA